MNYHDHIKNAHAKAYLQDRFVDGTHDWTAHDESKRQLWQLRQSTTMNQFKRDRDAENAQTRAERKKFFWTWVAPAIVLVALIVYAYINNN